MSRIYETKPTATHPKARITRPAAPSPTVQRAEVYTQPKPVQRKPNPFSAYRPDGRPVQMLEQKAFQLIRERARNPLGKPTIQQKAAKGIQGSGHRLPHFDKVQASFGKHDLSYVQAYTGSQAKQASESIGAEAYATGSKIAFAESNPSLHTVAHEAAHIVQQQAGVQLKGGVGEAGDSYERQADAVADAVVQGKSAEKLLDNSTPIVTETNKPIQRKVAWNTGKEHIIDVGDIVMTNSANISDSSFAEYKETEASFSEYIADNLADIVNVWIEHKTLLYGFYRASNIADKFALLYDFIAALADEGIVDVTDMDESDEKYRIALTKVINLSSLRDRIIVSPIKPEGEAAQYMHFFPAGKDANNNYVFDMSNFKTKINDNDSLLSNYDPNQPRDINKQGLRTQVIWEPAEGNDHIGVGMMARPLGPEHPLGTMPSGTGKHVEARKAMDVLAGYRTDMSDTTSKGDYIAGHLLNEQLGGPGNDVRNLTPIPSYINKLHEQKVEHEVKDLVNNQRRWSWYAMDVALEDINNPTGAPLTSAQQAAINLLGGKYPAELIAHWGLVRRDGSIDEGKQVSLAIPNPLTINPLRAAGTASDAIYDEARTSEVEDIGFDITIDNRFDWTPEMIPLIKEREAKSYVEAYSMIEPQLRLLSSQTGELQATQAALMGELALQVSNMVIVTSDNFEKQLFKVARREEIIPNLGAFSADIDAISVFTHAYIDNTLISMVKKKLGVTELTIDNILNDKSAINDWLTIFTKPLKDYLSLAKNLEDVLNLYTPQRYYGNEINEIKALNTDSTTDEGMPERKTEEVKTTVLARLPEAKQKILLDLQKELTDASNVKESPLIEQLNEIIVGDIKMQFLDELAKTNAKKWGEEIGKRKRVEADLDTANQNLDTANQNLDTANVIIKLNQYIRVLSVDATKRNARQQNVFKKYENDTEYSGKNVQELQEIVEHLEEIRDEEEINPKRRKLDEGDKNTLQIN